jgi:hypothetical protein
MTQDPDRQKQQQHDEQEKKQQQPFQLLSPHPDDAKEIDVLDVDDDVSTINSPFSSAHIGGGDDIINKNNHNQGNSMMNKQKRNKVVSFRLSERDYERHLSMAKLCYENGLTKGPDIVSYIRLSMECLWQYINNSQARVEPSAEEKEKENRQQQPQKKQEGSVEQQQDVVDYHPMTASSPSRAAATAATTKTAAIGEQRSRESIARTTPPQPPLTPPLFNNLHEYFQPVFDQLDKLNKMLDSHIEEENSRGKDKKK